MHLRTLPPHSPVTGMGEVLLLVQVFCVKTCTTA